MSVYTSVSDDEMRTFLTDYDLGDFISLVGIAQGVTNSNYFLTTSHGRYVLTVFEVLQQHELPFFSSVKTAFEQSRRCLPGTYHAKRRSFLILSWQGNRLVWSAAFKVRIRVGRPLGNVLTQVRCWPKCTWRAGIFRCIWKTPAMPPGGMKRQINCCRY